MTQAELLKVWEERIAAFKTSGQSVKAWCSDQDLKPRQLWYWLKKLQNSTPKSAMPSKWLSVEIADQHAFTLVNTLFVRVGQAVVEVQPGFSPALLTEVVRSLTPLC